MTISFCGHSDFTVKEDYEHKVLAFLEETVGSKAVNFYLGDHGDFDSFAYNCCRKYKSIHPEASLIFITPYMTVEYQMNHLEDQKARYDGIIYPMLESTPPKFAIIHRNMWMVDQSDIIICGIAHSFGGAFKMYQYAKRKKKRIFNVFEKDI